MRYLLISLAAFLLFALPAFASTQPVTVTVVVPPICDFVVTGTLDYNTGDICWSGDNVMYDYVTYHICCNSTPVVTATWAVTGYPDSHNWTNLALAMQLADGSYVAPGGWGWYPANCADGSWYTRVTATWPVFPGTYSGVLTYTLACS